MTDLKALRNAADQACQAADERRTLQRYGRLPAGTVSGADTGNWGDLSCVEARHVINDAGDEGDEVVLGGVACIAAPDCRNLHAFIRNWLAAAGFPNIRVITVEG